jgi:MSHA biogenesis protein MshI
VLGQLFRRRKSLSNRKLCLVLQPNSVTVAVVEGGQRFIKQLPSHPDDYVSSIKLLSQEVELSHSHCQIILAHGLYQGAQVDNPNVPDNEILQALAWSTRELFTIAPESQIIDYYQNYSNNPSLNKLQVVACDKSIVSPVVNYLHDLDIVIAGISVEDIVVTQLLKQAGANVLVFHVPGSQVLIAIIDDGKLCFSRRIQGYDNFHQMSEVDFSSGMLTNLGLEVQRSIDFALGQLRLSSIDTIIIAVQNFDLEHLLVNMQELFDLPIKPIELDTDDDFTRFPVNVAGFAELALDRG